MQHQPNITAALSVATHCNGQVAFSPVQPNLAALVAALKAGDVTGTVRACGVEG